MAAALRRLTLARFRSYASATLTLEARPIALVGRNGAGKTNLLEAVSLLSPGRGLRRAAADALPQAPGAGAWRVRAVLEAADGPHDVVLTAEPGARRRVEIDGKAAAQTALGALAPMLWLTPAMDRLWIEGADGRRRFLDRAALSFAPAHAAAASAYDKAMRERNRLLRDGPADPIWLDALEARMVEAGLAVAGGRVAAAARLTQAMSDAKTLFPLAEIAILGAMEQELAASGSTTCGEAGTGAEIAEEFRRALARGRAEDAAAGRALTGPHRSDLACVFAAKGVAAALCSTGEQKALLVSLTLANARALARDGAAPILLLDEVAAHLDAERRAALFDEVCALGGQTWMTGAGPEAFEALGDRAQTFAVEEGADGSALRPL